jgi:hypothetical protein
MQIISADGIYVMTASATDFDDPTTPNAQLRYDIMINKIVDGGDVFRIDPKNGKIFALVCLLKLL